jgi:hypothetical protein
MDLTITTNPDSQLETLEVTIDVPSLSTIQRQGNPLHSITRHRYHGWGFW